jgi:UDP-perosamine 4-acetyltransferase
MTSPSPVVVIGAGGHAKVVVAALGRLGRSVAGLVDASPEARGRTVLGAIVLGDDRWLLSQDRDGVELVLGVGSVGVPVLRRVLFDDFRAAGFRFATLIDPAALVGPECILGEGVQVMAGAVVQPCVELAANVLVNTGARVDHDCRIGAHSHLAPGTVLSGGVRVGEMCHLGTGAVAIQGMEIGDRVVVGAGSVVVGHLPAGVTVMGNPARERMT